MSEFVRLPRRPPLSLSGSHMTPFYPHNKPLQTLLPYAVWDLFWETEADTGTCNTELWPWRPRRLPCWPNSALREYDPLENALDFAQWARGLIWKYRLGHHRTKAKMDMRYAFSLFFLKERWSEHFILFKQGKQFQLFLGAHPPWGTEP